MTQGKKSITVSRQSEPVRGLIGRAVAKVAPVLVVLTVLFAFLSLASAQTNLTFEKSSVQEGTWLGTVSGDISGRLVSTMIAADQSQPVWQIELYWIVLADDPAQSFIARMTGTLDSETGAVQMSGSVVDGFQEGAAVSEAGQLQDAETSAFAGTITIETAASRPLDDAAEIYTGLLRVER